MRYLRFRLKGSVLQRGNLEYNTKRLTFVGTEFRFHTQHVDHSWSNIGNSVNTLYLIKMSIHVKNKYCTTHVNSQNSHHNNLRSTTVILINYG